jgi:ubiquinone/menaquinone biosynthesis C-methylase UbiE
VASEALAANQQIVRLNDGMLTDAGIRLDPASHILDFGCGSGRHVYEYLDAGYQNIFGYDVKQYLDLRDESDANRFCCDETDHISHIPFPDNSFDFIYSYSVFEHVLDPVTALTEIYRVLKPGGVSINNFPAKWRPIEPHIFIPFGAAFRGHGYYRFWSAVGVGAKLGGKFSRKELGDIYYNYGQTGLHYPTGQQIGAMLDEIFDDYKYITKSFLRWSPGVSRFVYPLATVFAPVAAIFEFLHTRVVLLEKRKV